MNKLLTNVGFCSFFFFPTKMCGVFASVLFEQTDKLIFRSFSEENVMSQSGETRKQNFQIGKNFSTNLYITSLCLLLVFFLLEQAAQRSCVCSIFRSIQGQVGQGFETT